MTGKGPGGPGLDGRRAPAGPVGPAGPAGPAEGSSPEVGGRRAPAGRGAGGGPEVGGRRVPAGRPPGPSGAAPGPARPGRRRLAPDGVDKGAPRQESLGGAATGGWPRIDPRFAERWTRVRREQGRRRLRILVAAGAVVVVTGLGVGALYSPLLNVRHIRVSAPASVPRPQLLAIAGVSHPRPLVDIDAGQVAARLDAVPSLGAARVTKQWPATLTISVVRRTPVAVVARAVPAEGRPGTPATSSPGWATVDATGRVLATVQAAPGLPVLQGLGEVPAPGQWLAGSPGPAALRPGRPGTRPLADLGASPDSASVPGGAAAALAIVTALPPSLRSHALSVTVASGGQLRMEVVPAGAGSAGISVDLGDGSRLAAKLTALATLLSQANLAGVAQIDLTVPDRPATLTAR